MDSKSLMLYTNVFKIEQKKITYTNSTEYSGIREVAFDFPLPEQENLNVSNLKRVLREKDNSPQAVICSYLTCFYLFSGKSVPL